MAAIKFTAIAVHVAAAAAAAAEYTSPAN